MKITDLEEYEYLKREAQHLKEKIKQYSTKSNNIVSDTVKGSTNGFPSVECTFTVTGLDYSSGIKVDILTERLRNRKEQIDNKRHEIELFIDNIESSEIRQIIQYRYVDGYSWVAVSIKVYGYPCGDRARMKITRFFLEN